MTSVLFCTIPDASGTARFVTTFDPKGALTLECGRTLQETRRCL